MSRHENPDDRRVFKAAIFDFALLAGLIIGVILYGVIHG